MRSIIVKFFYRIVPVEINHVVFTGSDRLNFFTAHCIQVKVRITTFFTTHDEMLPVFHEDQVVQVAFRDIIFIFFPVKHGCTSHAGIGQQDFQLILETVQFHDS